MELGVEPVYLRWVQADLSFAVEACLDELFKMMSNLDSFELPFSDVVLLTSSHSLGLQCVQSLEQKNVNVEHVFDSDSRKSRSLKLAFHLSDSRVKACTIHSFKGWESRALIVLVTSAETVRDRSLVYVALSRLKRSLMGSALTVICTAPKLLGYGKTWPDFSHYDPLEHLDDLIPPRSITAKVENKPAPDGTGHPGTVSAY